MGSKTINHLWSEGIYTLSFAGRHHHTQHLGCENTIFFLRGVESPHAGKNDVRFLYIYILVHYIITFLFTTLEKERLNEQFRQLHCMALSVCQRRRFNSTNAYLLQAFACNIFQKYAGPFWSLARGWQTINI